VVLGIHAEHYNVDRSRFHCHRRIGRRTSGADDGDSPRPIRSSGPTSPGAISKLAAIINGYGTADVADQPEQKRRGGQANGFPRTVPPDRDALIKRVSPISYVAQGDSAAADG